MGTDHHRYALDSPGTHVGHGHTVHRLLHRSGPEAQLTFGHFEGFAHKVLASLTCIGQSVNVRGCPSRSVPIVAQLVRPQARISAAPATQFLIGFFLLGMQEVQVVQRVRVTGVGGLAVGLFSLALTPLLPGEHDT